MNNRSKYLLLFLATFLLVLGGYSFLQRDAQLGYAGNVATRGCTGLGIFRKAGIFLNLCNTSASFVDNVPTAENLMDVNSMITYISPNEVAIWSAPSSTTSTVQVRYREASSSGAYTTLTFPSSTDNESTNRRITGLTANTEYDYDILVNGSRALDDGGTFYTGVATGTPFTGRFSIVSCNNPDDYASQPVYESLLSDSARLLLQLGDTHYANSTVTATVYGDTLKQRRVPQYGTSTRHIASLAVWDDHDFCGNDVAGEDCAGRINALAIWQQLWISPSYGEAGNPGLYHKVAYGDVDVFMLDTRYYRNGDNDPDDATKDMLGNTQFEWLEREVRSSTAKFKLISFGSTVWASNFDGWSLYSVDRARLLALTRTTTGIIFLAGDIHNSYIERRTFVSSVAGYPVYNVISSGIATDNGDGHFSYVNLDIDTTAVDPYITATVRRFTSTTYAESPRSPNVASTSLEYQEQYMVTTTIYLSELQLPTPGVPYYVVNDPADGWDSNDSPIWDATTTLTVAGWFRVDAGTPGTTNFLFRRYGGTADNRVFQWYLNTSKEMVVTINGPSAGRTSVGMGVVTSTWFFAAFTYDGAQAVSGDRLQLYATPSNVCTQLTKSGASTIPTSLTSNTTTIGFRGGVPGNIKTSTRIVSVFNKTLSSAEVCALYNNWVNSTDRDWTNEPGIIALFPLQESYDDVIQGVTSTLVVEPDFIQGNVP